MKSRTCAKNFKRGELIGLVVYPRPESGERVCMVEVRVEVVETLLAVDQKAYFAKTLRSRQNFFKELRIRDSPDCTLKKPRAPGIARSES